MGWVLARARKRPVASRLRAVSRSARSRTSAIVVTALLVSAFTAVAGTVSGPASAATSPPVLSSCPALPYGYSQTLSQYGTAANAEPLYVDEFLPTAANGHQPPSNVPGVILVHGGGWTQGNFSTATGDGLAPLAECLAQNGIDAFSIDYALTDTYNGTSQHSFPQNLKDINTAIGWAKQNAGNLIASQIFILGTSAGGNLAALAGENAMSINDGLAGVISQSGPTDLAALGVGCSSMTNCPGGPGNTVFQYLGCYNVAGSSCTLEGADGHQMSVPAAQAYSEASPVSAPTATVPYLIAASSDETIPLAQATALAQTLNGACSAAGGHTSDQLAVIPGDQHAETYTDVIAGPELDFIDAVTGGTLPGNCATASPLTGAAMAYDAGSTAGKTIIRFGGCCTAQGQVSGATQWYDTTAKAWKDVTITSAGQPSPRLGATLSYDPVNGALMLFGGENLPGGSREPVLLNDTWEFIYTATSNSGVWTQACTTCTVTPSPRYGAAADQAPGNMGVTLFGGEGLWQTTRSTAPAANNETWLWNGTTWSQLTPGGTAPPIRYGTMLAYDGPHNADVLYGGDQPTSACDGSCLNLLDDTWSLTVSTTTGAWTWTQKEPDKMSTGIQRDFTAGASGASGAMLFGGLIHNATTNGTVDNDEQVTGDTWTWTGSAWTRNCSTCAPPAVFGAAIAYQRFLQEDLLYGGYTSTSQLAAPAITWIWSGSTWAQG